MILVPFFALYAWGGALDDLYQGLFVDPAKRLQFAASEFPSLVTLWTAIPPIALVAWSARWKPRTRWALAGGLLASAQAPRILP